MSHLATELHVDDIADLERVCFGSSAWSEATVRDEILSPQRVVRVDLRNAHVLAYAAISVVGDVADLERIATRHAMRGRGVARGLLTDLIGDARDLGAERMLLEVAADNSAAIGLYESFGFSTVSTRKAYYPDGGDALVMELSIEAWR